MASMYVEPVQESNRRWGPVLIASGLLACCGAFMTYNPSEGSTGTSMYATPTTMRPVASLRNMVTMRASRGDSNFEQEALSRRGALALTAGAFMTNGLPAQAIQGLTPGRIPGFDGAIDERGFHKYLRPAGKSGGHGVGWSEIPQYSFELPTEFEEVSVSIADLGGTEIDARFTSKEHGDVSIIVAPVARFKDIGYNARVTIDAIAEPLPIALGFAPEVMGNPIDESDILDIKEEVRDRLLYYQYQIKPRTIISATATGNRLFLLVIRANYRQWSKHMDELIQVADSFRVPIVDGPQ